MHPIPFFQLSDSHLEVLKLLDCVSLLLLVEFGAFSVSSDTLAFFAITTFVTVERTFVEEFSHFVGVEISLGDLASN